MKIFVHDFAGHPFQVQLSRELAARGHSVVHAYFAEIPGPKGNLDSNGDPGTLAITPIRLGRKFDAYSYVQRMMVHREYANVVKAKILDFEPDVVLSGNTPTDAQFVIFRECRKRGYRFVHWVQDFYALALQSLLSRKLGPAAKLLAYPFHVLERKIFRGSDTVVYISDDFVTHAAREKYTPRKFAVIENWATLGDFPWHSKDNTWARRHQLDDKFVFLYAGTMGLKHSPETLAQLARRFAHRKDVRVVLVSQGIGRAILEEVKAKERLDNLMLLDFQSYAELPEVLASADVLLANVEPDAGTFCVPSKILSYMCAGRAILMSVSSQNLAARIVTKANAGVICSPGEEKDFVDRASALYSDRATALQMGLNARRYAESTFDIDKIGSIFEAVLRGEESSYEGEAAAFSMRVSS
jgi:colanic acid biosynthesis glycosyl transferase WcaI